MSVLIAGVYFYQNYKLYISPNLIEERFFSAFKATGLQLKDVYVEGQKYTRNKDIISALGAKIGDPILTLPLPAIRERIENISWVKHAVIDRQYPSTLYIGIVERTPIAIGQKEGKLSLIDDKGFTIKGVDITEFKNLPIIIASDPGAYAPSMIAMIEKERELANKVRAIIRVSERRWNIRFDNNLTIMLPEKNYEKAWDRVIELNKKEELFNPNIKNIDLRIPNKIYFEEI